MNTSTELSLAGSNPTKKEPLHLTDYERLVLATAWKVLAKKRRTRHSNASCFGVAPFDVPVSSRSNSRQICHGCTEIFVDLVTHPEKGETWGSLRKIVALAESPMFARACMNAWSDTIRRRNGDRELGQRPERKVERARLKTLGQREGQLLRQILLYLAGDDSHDGSFHDLPVERFASRFPDLFEARVRSRVVDDLLATVARLDPELAREIEAARNRRAPQIWLDQFGPQAAPFVRQVSNELRDPILRAAFEALPQHHREVVELVAINGLTCGEAAKILGRKEARVQTEFEAASVNLRKLVAIATVATGSRVDQNRAAGTATAEHGRPMRGGIQ